MAKIEKQTYPHVEPGSTWSASIPVSFRMLDDPSVEPHLHRKLMSMVFSRDTLRPLKQSGLKLRIKAPRLECDERGERAWIILEGEVYRP